MIAGDIMTAQFRPWLAEQKTARLRLLVPAVSITLVWWLSVTRPTQAGWLAIVAYCLLHLLLITVRQHPSGEAYTHRIAHVATVIDMLFVVASGVGILVIGGAIYPFAAILGLRIFTNWRRLTMIAVLPLVTMLGYLVANLLVPQVPALSTLPIVTAWWIVVAGIGLCLLAVLTNMRQRREMERLRQALRAESQIREARVGELERTTNELRMRMREQHALEEGLRAVTSSLSLNEVLHQIVDSTVQTLGREHVSGMDLSLLVDDELTHHSYTRDGSDSQPWASVLAHRSMQQGVPLIISDATHHDEFAALGHRLRSAISVPLFVGEGTARGALTVVSGEAAAFSSSNTRHLAAFAAQAGIAIGNAELHSQMREQQRLLEAVVRDINDGLIVVNDSSDIVLTNPTGQQLLDASSEANSIHERLMEIAASARTGELTTVIGELKIKPEGESSDDASGERVYQALASRIQQDADSQLVAIVLHDITHYRDEERARTEFISMVSHELRNPLHSLNGFLKVVIQGRAGTLAPLQQDFLQMADEQVELLKGRISELLEFNRMRAGRLTLKPKMNDLSLLMVGTVNRLTLQAEQTGLQLTSRVSNDLPECFFDSERIGQVLTNLIENAIKATPAGGKIAVSSHLHDNEIWISISDTGIGIAQSDIGKIFQRFYRANTQKSVYGNHLGLGLAICQQIVEGHGGRIWVESELNVGSTFSFALSLITEEAVVEVS